MVDKVASNQPSPVRKIEAQHAHNWIQAPNAIKPGSLVPAMRLSDADLNAVVKYIETLR
jgi:cytochrome c1